MKGPRSRHKFNVLRVWECPQCKKRAFAPPQIVNRTCECQGKDRPTWMCLIEPAPKPRKNPLNELHPSGGEAPPVVAP